jgi:3-hydroxyacyl-CoA dehydrogenase/enoyl-CoA hydratase/3-hydroxybutyryl-CoA epimerase
VARPRRAAAAQARSRHDRRDELKHRLLAIQALETARCFEEGVLTDVREADVGSILGFGYAPYSGGTLSYIDMMGTKKFVALCERSRRNTASASSRTSCWSRWRKGESFYTRFAPKRQKAAA